MKVVDSENFPFLCALFAAFFILAFGQCGNGCHIQCGSSFVDTQHVVFSDGGAK